MLQLESQPEEKANNHKIIQTEAQQNSSVPSSYKPSLEHYYDETCNC